MNPKRQCGQSNILEDAAAASGGLWDRAVLERMGAEDD